ncbi:vac1p-like-protein [Caudoviricetes sp.]|nr:vac1p-like-protein [Caudoviricetes sp.]
MMRYHFSLHRTKTQKNCEMCGCVIPARKAPDYAEYWRVKGGERGSNVPRVVCCLCHALYDLPTDGWESAPDGRETIAAFISAQGCGIRA